MSPSATSINVCFDYYCVSTRRIPLLASPRGGVAEQSRKCRAASAFARTGWCSDRWDKEHHPGSVNNEASRRFLGDAATPPRGDARRGIRSFQNDTSKPPWTKCDGRSRRPESKVRVSRCVDPSATLLPTFENADVLLVASRNLGDGRLPGELAGTPINHRLPEGGPSDCEANESGNRRCDFQPLVDLLVVCTSAQNDAADFVPAAAPGSRHDLLAVFAAVEPFDLPQVRLNTGLLQLFDGP